jgi:phage terminase large subunit GpA-like protein
MQPVTKGAALLIAAFCSAFAPPEPLSLSQWAEGRIVIPAEASTSVPGPLSWKGFEYCREPLNRLHFDDTCSRVTLMAAAQSGKSNIGVVWVSWIIAERPRAVGIAMPSLAKVREFNAKKLQPVIDATPALKRLVLPVSTRDERGSTTTDKAFPGGSILIYPASSPNALQMTSYGALWMTETPNFLADVGGRGAPIPQARTRMDGWEAFGTKELHESTPGELGTCPVTADFHAGDQCMFYMPCPHCDFYHRWEWPDFVVPREATTAPTIKAPCCGAVVEERHKPAMVAAGIYLPTFVSTGSDNPEPPRAVPFDELARWAMRDVEGREPSYYFWQVHSPLKTWAGLAADFRESEGSAASRAAFRQQKLGLASDPAAAAPDHALIVKSAKAIGVRRGEVPAWACWLALTFDVQGDRLEWAAFAFGPDAWARFDRGVIEHDPLTVEAWTAAAAITARTYTGARVGDLGFDAVGVDSGGKDGVSPQVYRFTRARGTRAGAGNVRSLKGASRELPAFQPAMERPVKVMLPGGRKVRHHILFIDTYVGKRQVYGALAAFVAGADEGERRRGSLLLEIDTTDEDAKQITAERLILPKTYRHGERGVWDRVYPSNEQLDLAVYAWALAHWKGIWSWDAARWEQEFAAKAKPAAEIAAPLEKLWNAPVQPEATVAGADKPRGGASRFAAVFAGKGGAA